MPVETISEEGGRLPRHLLVRFAVLVLIVAGGFAALRWTPLAGVLSKEAVLAMLERLRGTWWAPALLVGSYVVLCPLGFPASPLMVAGGMVFGTLLGSVYNFAGVFLGGAATYYLGLHLGRDFVRHLGGKRMRRVERAIQQQGGFWSLVGIRFLPLPYALVNYCAALAGISPSLFLSSTATGLAMTIPIFTYFAATLTRAASGARSGIYLQFGIAVVLLVAVTLLPRVWAGRKRRERYRELCAARARRRSALSPSPGTGEGVGG